MNHNKIHYFTYATHCHGLYNKLINNEYKVKIITLGWNKPWNNFLDKIKGLYDAIDKLDNNDIVVFLDGFDSIVNKNPKHLRKLFKNFNADIVASKELLKYGYYITKKIFTSHDGNIANSGMYMGYVYKIKDLCKFIINQNTTDDQRALNIARKTFNIKIDEDYIIFENRKSIKDIKNKDVYFVSYPAASNANFKEKLIRYYRAIYEYTPFFKFELLIFFLLVLTIFLIIKFRKKKL